MLLEVIVVWVLVKCMIIRHMDAQGNSLLHNPCLGPMHTLSHVQAVDKCAVLQVVETSWARSHAKPPFSAH